MKMKVVIFSILFISHALKLGGAVETLEKNVDNLTNELTELTKKLDNLEAELTEARGAFIRKKKHKKLTFDKSNLKNYAVTQGFGYKTGNLVELKKITSDINKKLLDAGLNLTSNVPKFMGISSDEIKDFLSEINKFKKIDINQRWEAFQANKDAIKENNNKLTNEAKQILEKIRDDIKKIFSHDEFYFQHDITNDDENSVAYFLKNIKNVENERFMVRSTGKEDTETLANAGGNDSVAAVKPTVKDISFAIGTVIASYFREKSINQRLIAGDESIFNPDETPFVPVLIQIMIGEQVGGVDLKNKGFDDFVAALNTIPVSGVMFTQEAEGKTPGVTHIQTAFGHAELVVNSLGAVDTFFVGPSNIIHKIIKRKTYRLIPFNRTEEEIKEGKSSLDFTPNHPIIEKTQSLYTPFVKALKIIADEIETYYGAPRDIEFVVNKAQKQISLVQARPIVHKKDIEPSYIKNIETIKEHDTIYPGTTIGAGGGALRIIESVIQKEDVIVTTAACIIEDNLPKALDLYLNSKSLKNIKCVITGKMAPSTSHEATTFRGQGIPVIYSSEIAAIKTLTPSSERPLVVDVQREIITQTSRDKFEKAEGWFAHPIPRQLSLDKPSKELYKKLKGFKQKLKKIKTRKLKNKHPKELLEIIKTGTKENKNTVLAACAEIVQKITQYGSSEKDSLPPYLMKELLLLIQNAIVCVYEIMQVIKKANEPRSLSVLYAVKFLEALLYQQPSINLVHDYSYGSIIKNNLEEQAVQKILEDIFSKKALALMKLLNRTKVDHITQLIKVIKVALTEKVVNTWLDFLKDLSKKDLSSIENFAKKIIKLQKFDVLGLWLNHDFMHYEDVLEELENDYNKSEDLLTKLNEKKAAIDALDMSKWENPANFEKQWGKFNAQIIDYFVSQKFINGFKRAGDLGRKVALAIMEELTNAFDHSIKSITGNPEYNLDDKIKNFRTMLTKFFEILKFWWDKFELTFSSNTDTEQQSKCYKENEKDWFEYKQKLLKGLTNRIDYPISQEEGLDEIPKHPISKEHELTIYNLEFNVERYALSASLSRINTVKPLFSLEEFFTITHQSIINIIVKMLQLEQEKTGEIIEPKIVKNMGKKIMSIKLAKHKEDWGEKVSFAGISLRNNTLKKIYNLPLHQHSSTMTIEYKKRKNPLLPKQKKDICTFTASFFGWNDRGRWEEIKEFIEYFNEKLGFTQTTIEQDKKGVSLSWNITNQTSKILKFIAKIINKSAIYTIGATSDEIIEIIKFIGSIQEKAKGGTYPPQEILQDRKNEKLIIIKLYKLKISFDPYETDREKHRKILDDIQNLSREVENSIKNSDIKKRISQKINRIHKTLHYRISRIWK